MLHGHNDFGQVSVSNTGTGKTLKIYTRRVFSFFLFFWKKFGYVVDTVVTHQNLPNTAKLKNKRERERERERERTRFGPTPLSFPQFFDLICAVCPFGVDRWQPNPLRHPTTPKLLLSHSAISLFAGFRFSVFWAFDSFFLCFFFLFF